MSFSLCSDSMSLTLLSYYLKSCSLGCYSSLALTLAMCPLRLSKTALTSSKCFLRVSTWLRRFTLIFVPSLRPRSSVVVFSLTTSAFSLSLSVRIKPSLASASLARFSNCFLRALWWFCRFLNDSLSFYNSFSILVWLLCLNASFLLLSSLCCFKSYCKALISLFLAWIFCSRSSLTFYKFTFSPSILLTTPFISVTVYSCFLRSAFKSASSVRLVDMRWINVSSSVLLSLTRLSVCCLRLSPSSFNMMISFLNSSVFLLNLLFMSLWMFSSSRKTSSVCLSWMEVSSNFVFKSF